MLTADQLREAELRGILTSDQRVDLIRLAEGELPETTQEAGESDGSEESFRLVGGGNDVFVGIGIVLLLAGVWSAITTFWQPGTVASLVAMAIFVWMVAEFITRHRRMKFSSLILAVAFAVCAVWVIGLGIADRFTFAMPENPLQLIGKRAEYRLAGWIACGSLALVAIIHFFRFRVPFMAAVMAISAIGLIVLLVADVTFSRVLAYNIQVADPVQLQAAVRSLLYVPLLCGLLIFATGVALDVHDRKRETVWSDCAFWLHVISAPLIVHPLFVLATGQNLFFEGNEASSSATVILIALIALFFYVALAIDRRSLLVPSLAYFGTVGIYYLVSAASQTTGIPSFAVILTVIGILIIVFGVGWQRIRALVVGTTLPHVILNKLPPVKI